MYKKTDIRLKKEHLQTHKNKPVVNFVVFHEQSFLAYIEVSKSRSFSVANMSFNAICENKIIAKISGFTVFKVSSRHMK